MVYSVYLSFLLASTFGVVAPTIARRVRPRAATWLLTGGGVIAALCATGALLLCALTLAGSDRAIAARGHWSAPVFKHLDPVKPGIAVLSGILLIVLVGRGIAVAVRRELALRALRRALERVPAAGDLVVLGSDEIEAFAIPAAEHRIAVSRGALTLLSESELDAVVAHERSHLEHRHHLHRLVVVVAAAMHPLLWRLPATQELVTERWADVDAARQTSVQDVAAALRHVKPVSGFRLTSGVLAAGGAAIEQRIIALSRPGSRWNDALLLVGGWVLATAVALFVDAVADSAWLFHAAALAVSH